MPSLAEARMATILAVLATWVMVVPYVARALDLEVGVRSLVEVVDHVVPGCLALVGALYLCAIARTGPWDRSTWPAMAAGASFLAAFWVLLTHVPLVLDAAAGVQRWSAAIWHSAPALPLAAVALWCLVRTLPKP